MKHMQEPWEVHHARHCDGEYWASIGYNGHGPICDIVGEQGNPAKYYVPVAGMTFLATPVEEQKANAERIVQCVNACRGIANPKAIPEALDQLKAAAKGSMDIGAIRAILTVLGIKDK